MDFGSSESEKTWPPYESLRFSLLFWHGIDMVFSKVIYFPLILNIQLYKDKNLSYFWSKYIPT